jgi:predicted  nucleic acid-binding Zn-ribbon protein
LRLLRSRREMLAKLQEVANSKVADINKLLGSLIERRDEIWKRTEDERRAIEHQRASAFGERDSAYSDAERYRREISELGNQIEQLLRASA